jgi:methylmalonyl-CoA mutase N-terminal domain/subunit
VNEFEVDEEPDVDIEEVTDAEQENQIDRLETVRDERDDDAVEESLAAIREAADGEENLMPYLIDAVKAYATVGEICDAMRDVFGEYQG